MFSKSAKLKNFWPFLIILILSWWAVKPLLHPGFFPMHDDEQIARLYELHQALSAGQFPPRWVSNLGFGYGYPFYNFYPPFVYYLGEVFHLLGFSLIISTKIVMALGFILSGFFIYLLGKQFFGKAGGVISAIFYIYAPYHALDLYVRGALAEFYSFVFLPAVFWSTLKLIQARNKRWLIVNSLFLSFLLLSHNLITIIFLPFYFLYFLFLLLSQKKTQRKKAVLIFSLSFLLFLGATCYFWLPALVEKKYTLVDEILTRELASYKHHFVYLRQLWHSPWGYGGSIFGLEDGISFEVGKLHLLFALLSLVFLPFLLKKRKKEGLLFAIYYSLFTISLFMTSFHSQFIWDRLRFLWYLQFPWRFLIFAVFFSSLLAGALTGFLFRKAKIKLVAKWLLVFSVLSGVIFINKNFFQPGYYLAVTDKDYITEEELKWRVSKMSFEYVPKGVATKLSDIETTQLDLEKDEIARTSFEITRGALEVIEIKNLPQKKILKTKGEGELRLNVFNFPGWKAFLNGSEIGIRETGKLRLIALDIPEGEHQVKVVFTDTPVRKLANLISLSALIVILVGGVYAKKIF